jgi:hypothetical protein
MTIDVRDERPEEVGVPARRSFAARFAGAFRFDGGVYREVEHDPKALAQAALVVAIGGLARGAGAFSAEGWTGLVGNTLAALVLWAAATGVVMAIGVRILGGTSRADELLRTLGFAAAPLSLLVLSALPLGAVARSAVFGVAHLWAVAVFAVAVREALDVDRGRALLICIAALAIGLGAVALLGGLVFGANAR